jgi:hypothetical protein
MTQPCCLLVLAGQRLGAQRSDAMVDAEKGDPTQPDFIGSTLPNRERALLARNLGCIQATVFDLRVRVCE